MSFDDGERATAKEGSSAWASLHSRRLIETVLFMTQCSCACKRPALHPAHGHIARGLSPAPALA
eukprot:1155171-Pelagomonas_calceolata.AAC.5